MGARRGGAAGPRAAAQEQVRGRVRVRVRVRVRARARVTVRVRVRVGITLALTLSSLTGKKKKLAVEDHEVDHPGHHYGSEDERGQKAQIGVVSITKAIRTEDVPSPRPAVEIISRKVS